MKLIKEITNEGLYYIEQDATFFVDFSECNRNWLLYRKRTENLNDDQLHYLKSTDKVIGQRDSIAEPPFFEFFTRPFTRIEFDEPDFEKSFNELHERITAHGWRTIDLS